MTPEPTGQSSLGTLLRHLTELLDSAVEQAYLDHGLDYRPRYTPVVRVLLAVGPASLRTISSQAGISHSAVSQTVSEMVKQGWLVSTPGLDARERIVSLTQKAEGAVPLLQNIWAATTWAAETLDADLAVPLSGLLTQAIEALDLRPFGVRIQEAKSAMEVMS